jgi:hypothetical protein
MVIVECFLGVPFSWCISSSLVSVHLNQSNFASNLVESFFRETREASPLAAPYCSGIPVDSIAPSTDKADSPAQTCRMQAYQSLIGSIGWLAVTTRPDLMAIHSFLSSYSAKPAVDHMKLALYALHYIHPTFNYGITFTQKTWPLCIPTFIILCLLTSKPSQMPSLKNRLQLKPSPLTAMHVGVHKLATRLQKAPFSLYSSFGV